MNWFPSFICCCKCIFAYTTFNSQYNFVVCNKNTSQFYLAGAHIQCVVVRGSGPCQGAQLV
jgi:hypothetical protein